jgi:GT2 family glycosyltransferase
MRLIELERNLGYTISANIGMSRSKADWVVLLNSDTIVTPGWLSGLFDVVDSKPNIAMVGPLSNAASWQSVPDLYDARGKWNVNKIPDGWTVDDVAAKVRSLAKRQFPRVTLLNGFCTLIRRSVLEEVGYLDEASFPAGYGEENDLCVRVRKAGYELAIAEHVYVYHAKSASFGSKKRDELSKRGTQTLSAKHPEVDWRETQQVMAELTPLAEIRRALRELIQQGGKTAHLHNAGAGE